MVNPKRMSGATKEKIWTPDQLAAIDTLDRDVTVSAGAGSGKTGVLAERFLRIVQRTLQGELPDSQCAGVEQILVITFTEKATREMKSRIARSLWDAGLHTQRRELENAFISTFHSFCARMLKENPFEAGVDPEFTVLEDSESHRLVRQSFEAALDNAFDRNDEEIIALASAAQNERLYNADAGDPVSVLSKAVVETLNKLRGAGWREEALRTLLETGSQGLSAAAFSQIVEWISPVVARLIDLRRQLKVYSRGTIGFLENKRLKAAEALSQIEIPQTWSDIPALVGGIQATSSAVSGILKPRSNGPADDFAISEILGLVKEECKKLKDLADYDEERESAAAEHAYRFLKLALRTWELYSEAKQQQSVLDNEDLPAEAVHLLETSVTVRNRYRSKFKHLLIDEFQDTDPLQVRLIDALHISDSPDSAPNSLFRVGDVQQSIYAFRNADPSIFQQVASESELNGSRLVTLSENFRTRPQILKFINLIFEPVWRESETRFTALSAGADFLEKEMHSVELLITADPRKRALYLDTEAQVIAKRIRSLVDEGFRLTRKNDETPGRSVRFGDIAILLRAITDVEKYERALQEAGVPYFVVGGGRGYYARFEIRDVMNLLTVIDSPLDDMALLATLRSPVAGLDIDTIYALSRFAYGEGRRSREPFFTSIPRFLESPESEGTDRSRLQDFYDKIAHYVEIEDQLPVGLLLERLVSEFELDTKLLVRPNGRRRLANLRKLLQLANSSSVHGVADFVRRLREIEKISEREGDAPTEEEDSDVVKLITIHKAKGLEFPVVFIADLARKVVQDDAGVFICDPHSAVLGCKLEDYRSAVHSALSHSKRKVAEEESLRLLYVAMTRAIDHLTLSGSTSTTRRDDTWADFVFPLCHILAPPSAAESREMGGQDLLTVTPFSAWHV